MNAGAELRKLFPEAYPASGPVEVAIGGTFEIVTVSERQGRTLVGLMDHLAPHPVGAVIADLDRWHMIVPPGSGEPCWPAGVVYQAEGQVWVPPLGTQVRGPIRWARYGNDEGRPFTAPLVVHPLLPFSAADAPADGGHQVLSGISSVGRSRGPAVDELGRPFATAQHPAGSVAVVAGRSDGPGGEREPVVAEERRTGFDLRYAFLHMCERMGPSRALRHAPFFGRRRSHAPLGKSNERWWPSASRLRPGPPPIRGARETASLRSSAPAGGGEGNADALDAMPHRHCE